MKRRLVIGCGLVFTMLVMVMVYESGAQVGSKTIIRLKGSNAMVGICDQIGREFAQTRPGIAVVAGGGGTDAGFDSFADGAVDVVMASRKINTKEMQQASISGVNPVELEVGRDSVAIFVHPRNSVSELTLEQLAQVLIGTYNRWNQVGGPDAPIVVIMPERVSGTALFLQNTVMNEEHFSSEALIRKLYYDIIKEVSKKPDAIGFAGTMDAEREARKGLIKIVAIKKDAASPAVSLSKQTTANGSYPLQRTLYFYWKGPAATKEVKDFVEFFVRKSQGTR